MIRKNLLWVMDSTPFHAKGVLSECSELLFFLLLICKWCIAVMIPSYFVMIDLCAVPDYLPHHIYLFTVTFLFFNFYFYPQLSFGLLHISIYFHYRI